MLYSALLRPLLFKLLAPEQAHDLVMGGLQFASNSALASAALRAALGSIPSAPVKAMGLEFKHPLGLAAGMDKNAVALRAWEALGFSHLEIGTVTPRPQPGNPQPRMFRLPEDEALINRMGFNNGGAEAAAARIRRSRHQNIIVGGNIGRNKSTPNEGAIQDYLAALNALYAEVDYIAVNVSSPNTPGLRDLQSASSMRELLLAVCTEAKRLGGKPVALKIDPDSDKDHVQRTAVLAVECGVQGIIATNTSIGRSGLATPEGRLQAIGAGGLSGAPIAKRSTEVVGWVRESVGQSASVVGVGGVRRAQDVTDKLNAGADLVQVYSGFVYAGPAMVRQLSPAWKQ
jgi:dihydroorotate dehydrogenase